jgi:hypothetical protein
VRISRIGARFGSACDDGTRADPLRWLGELMIDPGLKEKVVLITGANNTHGIGAGMARAFAVQGAKVFLHYLRQAEAGRLDAAGGTSTPGEWFYRSQQAKSADEGLSSCCGCSTA